MWGRINLKIWLVMVILLPTMAGRALAEGPPLKWEKTFGGGMSDIGTSVQQTSDGGYIITGQTLSFGAGYLDVYLIKTDSKGILQWQKTFGGVYRDGGQSVQQTTDSGYIIIGWTESYGGWNASDLYLIKTDSSGNLIWQKNFGGNGWDMGSSIQQTTDGGYIIIGTISVVGRYGDVYLIKTDPSGNLRWQKTFGGSSYDNGSSMQQTSDGGYIIAGATKSFGAGLYDVYLIKTDSSGNLLWQKTFGGNSDDGGSSVQQTTDGGYIISGVTSSFGAGGRDIYLIKTDPKGNCQWQKTFGGNSDDEDGSVQQTTDGGYVIIGTTSVVGHYGDVYLIKTDPNGNTIWQKTIGGSSYDNGYSIQQTSDGGYIIVGGTSSFGEGEVDVYLIKVGPCTIFVDAYARGANNGSSWKDAYKFLQDALADAKSSAKPVEIRVAQGIYKPDQGKEKTPGDRTSAFQLINGVTIKGGYAGFGKPDPNSRDVVLYKTILSANIGSILDKSDNCYHIFYHPEDLNLDDTAILDGFTITDGNANGNSSPYYDGGGMYNENSSPIVENCTFTRNSAKNKGGGIANNENSSPILMNCMITGNVADCGGGLSNDNSHPNIIGCSLIGNTAQYSGEGGPYGVPGGGAMFCYYSSPIIMNCVIKSNTALNWCNGGGVYCQNSRAVLTNCMFIENSGHAGGGMFNEDSSPSLVNCTFSNNSTSPAYYNQNGGGMLNDNSSPELTDCTFDRNLSYAHGGGMLNYFSSIPILKNCLFIRNSANMHGGGMFNGSQSAPEITNCLFIGNLSAEGGGIRNWSSNPFLTGCTIIQNNGGGITTGTDWNKPQLTNCILWGNYYGISPGERDQINGGEPDINYCCIQGWTGTLGGTGNIGDYPLFEQDDYHLLPNSPCINAGDPKYVPGPNEMDIDGEQRVMLGRIDMGADEFNPFEVNFVVINKRRIYRTVFEYDCNVTLRNISRFAMRNVQLEIVKTSENMVIIEPKVTFGDVEIGSGESATSIDTCTFQVDRSETIKPVQIVWKSTCQITNSAQEIHDTASGMAFLRLENNAGDGKVNLAGLVDKWLWTGDAGSIQEDVTGDGIVNLADFAVLAGQ